MACSTRVPGLLPRTSGGSPPARCRSTSLPDEHRPHRRGSQARGASAGAIYGWLLVAVSFVSMGIAVNARGAFSLLFPPMLDEFGWNRGLTAGAFSFRRPARA